MTPEMALEAALDIVGGPAALARAIASREKPITSQAISLWKTCPPRWVNEVYAAARRAKARPVPTRQQLCPAFQNSGAASHPAPVSKPERGVPRKRR